MKRFSLLCLGLALLSAPAAAVDRQQVVTFEKNICRDVSLRHLVYLPTGYADDATRKWPLILFLHGAGERGNELDRVKANGLPNELAAGREVPAIVLSPQCPAGSWWAGDLLVENLDALLDDALVRYRVDPRRIYVTGLSMGGFGTWALAAAHPERFAAIAPVCGGGNPEMAGRLRRLPIWAFHGAKDDVVPIRNMTLMTEAMARVQGDMRTTTYPEAGHDAWSATYANPEFYTWLLGHERTEPALLDLGRAVATASSGNASLAIDGDGATRWETERSDPQWLLIDLGAPAAPRRMVIVWETAYGKAYDLRAAIDGRGPWTTVVHQPQGDGAVDVLEFPAGFSARFLRLDIATRGTEWGDSIWEIELESK